jgi:hypothetical protein
MAKKLKIDWKIGKEETGQGRKADTVLLREEEGVIRRVKYDDWVLLDKESKSDDWMVGGSNSRAKPTDPNAFLMYFHGHAKYLPLNVFMTTSTGQKPSRPPWLTFEAQSFSTSLILQPVLQAINESSPITELPANWDDNGAMPVSQETWIKATGLLKEYATFLAVHYNLSLSAPQIDAVPDGSIDLFWKESKAQLLINVPPGSAVAAYYGDTYSEGDKIKGKIPLEGIKEYLAVWMKILSS